VRALLGSRGRLLASTAAGRTVQMVGRPGVEPGSAG